MRNLGSRLLSGVVVVLLLGGSAHAGVLFFDNLQQFPGGTVLTQTNYVPNVGASADISVNESSPGTAIVATNFPGSSQVLFEPGAIPYEESYQGFPTEVEINQLVTLSFTLWIPATNAFGHFGGFGVDLLTTNSSESDLPLLFVNDDGRVLVFTNAAAIFPLDLPFVQIGSWGALAGTVMSNALVLDYPAGTLSFSMNGTVLTNMAIPAFITNVFDAVRVQAFEAITGAGNSNSLGNTFALGRVLVTVPAGSTNPDISKYTAAAKGQLFEQLTSGAPTLSATGFIFQADVNGPGSNTIFSATDQIPGGSNIVLSLNDLSISKFKFQALFTTKSAMDAAFTNGAYLMTISTSDEGTLTPSLTLPGDDYPNPPQLLNFDAAQVIDTSTNFVFVWGSFTNGTTNDVISFEIDDAFGNTITNTPDIGEPGALDGTATNLVVPAGMLTAGSTNTGVLEFIKVTVRDTNSVAGALGVTGYFEQTQFSIVVGGTTNCVFAISPTNATFTAAGGSGGVNITAPNGCAWTATNNNSFITITSGSSGSGDGTVNYSVAATTNTIGQTGSMTIAGQTFTVTQAGTACSVSPASTSASFSAAGGSSNIVITANGTNCAWTATSNSGFITITAGSSGSGNGTVSYTVAANTNTIGQTGTMTVAGQTFTVTEAALGCSVSPASTSASFSAAGGPSNIVITASGTNCAWTAVSNSGFIMITAGSSGSGNGTVSYTVAANTNTIGQTGSMTVAGRTFTVTEAATGCSVSPASTSASFSAAGGSSNIVITANGTNCAWTATSNSGFITITGGSSGSGNGAVSYTVAANTNTIGQTGSMTVAGQTFTVTEAATGCSVSPASTSASFSAAGGSSNIVITASATNCAWTAVSNSGFIMITAGSSGSGNGTVSYTVAANTTTNDLMGTMTIAGQTFTVTQPGASSENCTFTLNATSATLAAKGGKKTVRVKAKGTNCIWTAVSNDSFITITSGTSGTGKAGKVEYTVPGNTNTGGLFGTMTIAGQTFTVTQQGGGCTFKLSPKNKKFKAAGGTGRVKVNPNLSDCDWTAISNDPSFITITSGASGAGKGTVTYTIPANATSNVITGTMTIAGETFTVIQSGVK